VAGAPGVAWPSAPLRHQSRDRIDVVALDRIFCHAVSPDGTALDAAMDDHQSLAGTMVDALRSHHPAAARRAVTWLHVEVP